MATEPPVTLPRQTTKSRMAENTKRHLRQTGSTSASRPTNSKKPTGPFATATGYCPTSLHATIPDRPEPRVRLASSMQPFSNTKQTSCKSPTTVSTNHSAVIGLTECSSIATTTGADEAEYLLHDYTTPTSSSKLTRSSGNERTRKAEIIAKVGEEHASAARALRALTIPSKTSQNRRYQKHEH
jgi:hypothetical protein